MNNPLVSIIMPVRNGSNYISEALSAIKSQNVNMEIIVVDDFSNDDTCAIVENFGCILLKHSASKGAAAAKNSALKVARGKYIMFHDHDDVMNQGALARMLKEFEEASKETFIVMAQLQDFFSSEMSEEERRKIILKSKPYSGLFSGAILMKKEVFDVIGLFSEDIQAGDIIEWTTKVAQHNLVIKKLTFVAVNRRIHKSNFGRISKEKEFKDYATIFRSRVKKGFIGGALN